MTTLTPDTLLTRNPDLISTDMDGDTVMMSIERGEYFGIGGVGPKVWDLLAEPTTPSAIVQTVCAEYEVEPAACAVDMDKFLAELLQGGLVLAV